MRSDCILTYYHPSTAVVVDDSELFALNLSLRFSASLALEASADPRQALRRVNENSDVVSLLRRCFPASAEGRTLAFHMAEIQDEIAFPGRFRRVSVVIVDYAMPAMNGLEFCRGLKDATVRKVLITGVGDQGLAMRAFNDGCIDRYLIKSDRRFFPKLVGHVRDLQREFFMAERIAIDSASTHIAQEFARDPAVVGYFHSLQRRLGVIEYYTVSDPPGVYMLTAEGEAFRLMILNDQELDAEFNRLSERGAPHHICEGVRSRRTYPGNRYVDGSSHPLGACPSLTAIHRLEGSEPWYVGLAREPTPWIDFSVSKSSYAAYLDTLDARKTIAHG